MDRQWLRAIANVRLHRRASCRTNTDPPCGQYRSAVSSMRPDCPRAGDVLGGAFHEHGCGHWETRVRKSANAQEILKGRLGRRCCRHLGGDCSGAFAKGVVGKDCFDGVADVDSVAPGETPASFCISVGVDQKSSTDLKHARSIGELVGEEWNDDHRDTSRQGAEGRPRSAVANDQRSLPQGLRLIDPGLDVDVAGHVAELGRSRTSVRRSEERVRIEPADSLQCRLVDLGCDCHVTEDRTEAHVDERGARTRPPVPQRAVRRW